MEKVDKLIAAIENQDKRAVSELLRRGANPYQVRRDGKSALSAWLQSQLKSEKSSIDIGLEILSVLPKNEYEEELLNTLVTKQQTRVASATGAYENIVARGGDGAMANVSTPFQSYQHARSCWAIVCNAYSSYKGKEPSINIIDYVRDFTTGEHFAQTMFPMIIKGVPVKKDTMLSPAPGENYNINLNKIISKYGHQVELSRTGSLISLDKSRPHNKPSDSPFYMDMDSNPSKTLGGIPISMWATQSINQTLAKALENKDFEKAKKLINDGADLNSLPNKDNTLIDLISNSSPSDLDNLISLGLDPSMPLAKTYMEDPSSTSKSESMLPIHHAKTQEQFDKLYEVMQKNHPHLLKDFTPQTGNAINHWKQSAHNQGPEDTLKNISNKLSGALNVFRKNSKLKDEPIKTIKTRY